MPKVAKKTAVPDTVEAIRAEAAKRTPDPKRFAKERRTDAAVKADSFEWNRSSWTIDGLVIHYFRTKDESVTGILCPEERELWKGFTYKFACDRLEVPLRPPEIFDPPATDPATGQPSARQSDRRRRLPISRSKSPISASDSKRPGTMKKCTASSRSRLWRIPGVDESGRCQGFQGRGRRGDRQRKSVTRYPVTFQIEGSFCMVLHAETARGSQRRRTGNGIEVMRAHVAGASHEARAYPRPKRVPAWPVICGRQSRAT